MRARILFRRYKDFFFQEKYSYLQTINANDNLNHMRRKNMDLQKNLTPSKNVEPTTKKVDGPPPKNFRAFFFLIFNLFPHNDTIRIGREI